MMFTLPLLRPTKQGDIKRYNQVLRELCCSRHASFCKPPIATLTPAAPASPSAQGLRVSSPYSNNPRLNSKPSHATQSRRYGRLAEPRAPLLILWQLRNTRPQQLKWQHCSAEGLPYCAVNDEILRCYLAEPVQRLDIL